MDFESSIFELLDLVGSAFEWSDFEGSDFARSDFAVGSGIRLSDFEESATSAVGWNGLGFRGDFGNCLFGGKGRRVKTGECELGCEGSGRCWICCGCGEMSELLDEGESDPGDRVWRGERGGEVAVKESKGSCCAGLVEMCCCSSCVTLCCAAITESITVMEGEVVALGEAGVDAFVTFKMGSMKSPPLMI